MRVDATTFGIVCCILLAAVGGGVSAAPGADDPYDCDEETEIPVAKSGDEVVRTENVSTAWYEHTEYVNDRKDEFVETYPLDEHDWLFSVGITATDESICAQSQMAITIGVTDDERAVEKFGESYEGIELIIDEGEPPVLLDDPMEGDTVQNTTDQPDDGNGNDATDNAGATTDDEEDNDDDETDPLPGFGVISGLLAFCALLAFRTRFNP